MSYDEARTITPGQVIRYASGSALVEATVTAPIHVFKRDRGRVVFVPVAGELVVHTRIVSVRDG